MKRIAIIPARAGSKGLKNKNIIDLCGKPLMAYSIEAAIKSKKFTHVIVSTDSKKYAKIAKEYGAEVLMRDEALSGDKVPTFDVIKDIISKVDEFDYFVLLQPTSPMRNYKHINEAIKQFEACENKYDFLVSVKEADVSSRLIKPIEADLSMKYFDEDYSKYRRQNTKEYSPNGAIYIAKPNAYLKQKHFFGKKTVVYIMNKRDSIDIDDIIDLNLAESVMGK